MTRMNTDMHGLGVSQGEVGSAVADDWKAPSSESQGIPVCRRAGRTRMNTDIRGLGVSQGEVGSGVVDDRKVRNDGSYGVHIKERQGHG
jgi:hypothetical protein